jgi:hypothetical protein
LPQLRLQDVEIDLLGNEFGGALFARTPAPLVVALGGHYHDLQISPPPLDFAQEHEPVHPRHVDVGENDDQPRPDPVGKLVERRFGRGDQMQDVGA